jgi:hypothetical protein
MSQRIVIFVLICIGISGTIVVANWAVISSASYEVGDLAANSLLIQSAKQFHLLIGNYSRIGFNHPGPAILYVLALGEFLFHDTLHLVASPIGGQLIIAAAYSAFWVTLIAFLFNRTAQNTLETVLFVTVFCAFLAHSEYKIFDGLWFPDLYVLPFAAFTLALAFFIQGEAASFVPLALAGGFLINGHVSFISTTAVMLLGGCVANAGLHFASRASKNPTPFLLSWRSMRAMAGRWIVALFIIVAFLTPLAIETVRSFPGPVGDYIDYIRGGHSSQTWAAALYYMTAYWAYAVPLAVALMIVCTMAVLTLVGHFKFSLITALLIASLAVLLYAKFGIDYLSYSYIALFYTACPALAIGLAAVAVCRLFVSPWSKVISVAIGLGCAFFLATQLAPPAYYADGGSHIPALYDRLRSLSDKPYVLDLDDEKDWGRVWTTIVGVEIYTRRQHVPDFFCIRRNWHILFTRDARCSEAQISQRKPYLVAAADAPHLTRQAPLVTDDGLSVFDASPTPRCLSVGESLSIADLQSPIDYYAIFPSGWSSPDAEFIWSIGPRAQLEICVQPGVQTLNLDLDAFLPNANSSQTISALISGKRVDDFVFDAHSRRGRSSITLPASNSDQTLPITLVIAHAISPKQVGQSADDRMLGVALYGIEAK